MEDQKILPNIPADESICLDDDDDDNRFLDGSGIRPTFPNILENLETIAISVENPSSVEDGLNFDDSISPLEQESGDELEEEKTDINVTGLEIEDNEIETVNNSELDEVSKISINQNSLSLDETTGGEETLYQSSISLPCSTPITNIQSHNESLELVCGETKETWHTPYDDGFESQLVRSPGGSLLEEVPKPEDSGLRKYFAFDNKVENSDPEACNFFDSLSSQLQDLNTGSFMNSFIMKSEDTQYEAEDEFAGGGGDVFPGNQTSLGKKRNLSESSQTMPDAEEVTNPISAFFTQDSNQDDSKKFFDELSQPKTLSSIELEIQPETISSVEKPIEKSEKQTWPVNQGFNSENTPDPFSVSLSISESDRRQDAWIPSEETHKTLVAIVTSPPGTYFPEQDKMTMPGLSISDALADPVYEFVYRFLGKQELEKRTIPNVCSVSQDENGLKELIKVGCYRAAVELIGTLLSKWGQGMGRAKHPSKHSQQSLQLWFCRIALLMKLQQFLTAEAELEAFGDLDQPDLYYEYYPDIYPGRRGSIIPFSFRMLYAQLPQYVDKHQEALDRLYKLRTVIKKILENIENGLAENGSMMELSDDDRTASKELWERRDIKVCYVIGNCLVSIREYNLAVEMYEYLSTKDINNAANLWSGIGRIYLQVGDLKSCQLSFDNVSSIDDSSLSEARFRSLTNKALLAIAHNSYTEAHGYYKEALEFEPDNPVIINNMAVCLLYMCKLQDALNLLENSIYRSPDKFLHDGVIFNLCTLYDLGSSQSHQKKLSLLSIVNQHSGDGFNIFCLKIKEKNS